LRSHRPVDCSPEARSNATEIGNKIKRPKVSCLPNTVAATFSRAKYKLNKGRRRRHYLIRTALAACAVAGSGMEGTAQVRFESFEIIQSDVVNLRVATKLAPGSNIEVPARRMVVLLGSPHGRTIYCVGPYAGVVENCPDTPGATKATPGGSRGTGRAH
jgi:hypothetical protein